MDEEEDIEETNKEENEDGPAADATPAEGMTKMASGVGGIPGLETQDDGNLIQNKEIAFIFNPNRDAFPEKPYFDDGNPELYSNEKMAKRKALKEDIDVQNALKEFITASFRLSAQKVVTRDEYFQKFTKIGQILRPSTEAEELQKLIKEDYDRDNNNNQQDTIDEDKLFESLFELADLW